MIENTKEIAILMATYNAEKYVARQIDSIVEQTNKDWVLYIRDDGSTDNTVNIINEYSLKNDNIVVIQDDKGNLKCRDNFFELLSDVNSAYYMFSDADDFWYNDKIELSLQKIKELEAENPNIPIIVHTDMSVTDSRLKIVEESMWRAGGFNPDKIKSYNYLGIHGFIGGATMIFNQKAKEVSLPVNKNVYMHDLWIGLCVIQQGIVYSIHKPTMLYRQHESNSVGGAAKEQLTLLYKLRNLRKVWRINIQTAKMLRKIGWGSFYKYLRYKIRLVILMRKGNMF